MGGRFGRRRKTQADPNSPFFDPYNPAGPSGFGPPPPIAPPGFSQPPPYPYGGGYDPYGEYDPMGVYGYSPTDSFETMYGGPMRGGGRYGRGFSSFPGASPWNYGNFYMGNTTMQLMPFMQRKVAKYAQRQMMSSPGGFGGGGFGGGGFGGGGFGGGFGCGFPMMPCLPASCALPVAPLFAAAAAPLPIAYNPIVQGMYPMAGINSANWMTPGSFMSALTTGPMPYRPPPSIEFPNNIGMVMTLPYGAPNPLLSLPSFGGFSPQYSFGGGMSCCCSFCVPSCAPPPVCYYPRPVSVPQPCPVPCPVPVPIPNIQQIPVPRQVNVVAPPIVAGCNPGFSVPSGAPLMSSQGGFMQGDMGQQLVMGSNQHSTTKTLLKDEKSEKPKRQTSIDQTRRAKAQKLAASLSNLGFENSFPSKVSSSRRKHRVKSQQILSIL